MKSDFKPTFRWATCVAVLACVTFLSIETVQGASLADLKRMSDQLDETDRQDEFGSAIAEANSCIQKRNFSCADSALMRAQHSARGNADTSTVASVRQDLASARQRAEFGAAMTEANDCIRSWKFSCAETNLSKAERIAKGPADANALATARQNLSAARPQAEAAARQKAEAERREAERQAREEERLALLEEMREQRDAERAERQAERDRVDRENNMRMLQGAMNGLASSIAGLNASKALVQNIEAQQRQDRADAERRRMDSYRQQQETQQRLQDEANQRQRVQQFQLAQQRQSQLETEQRQAAEQQRRDDEQRRQQAAARQQSQSCPRIDASYIHVDIKRVNNGCGSQELHMYISNNYHTRAVCDFQLEDKNGTWSKGRDGIGVGRKSTPFYTCEGTGRYKVACWAQPDWQSDMSCPSIN